MATSPEEWKENRTKIPPGKYELKCIKAEKSSIWFQGKSGYGQSPKVILWFEVFGWEHSGQVLPMYLALSDDGKIHQGSKFFICWYIANGCRRPQRARLKEMALSKFINKIFLGKVVDVKPKFGLTDPELPEGLHYSRVDILYNLLVGNSDL